MVNSVDARKLEILNLKVTPIATAEKRQLMSGFTEIKDFGRARKLEKLLERQAKRAWFNGERDCVRENLKKKED